MTTDNDADSPNTWRTVGRLEANVERLVQGQERLERRVERLVYGIIALGGGMLGLLLMEVLRRQ